ncbi:MAG: ceramidase domain-containing protein [Deltaproteobacteria bacterium]|nr:ceramidase domain-containing protein [Deltaproteobacteria bacterium]
MIKHLLLTILTISGLIVLFLIGPIPQDPAYHHFADTKKIFGIPNFFNVITNLPFIIIGIWGLLRVWTNKIVTSIKPHYIIFCAGIFLIGLGSSFYHLHPDNPSLVWDRLPITIAFMSFFSALIAEYISPNMGKKMLYPALAVGIVSVIYWHITETLGTGDLRPYAAIQYIPLALTPLILIMYEPQNTYKRYVFWSLVFYGLSKVFEILDAEIFGFFQSVISGHTIKHLLAAPGSIFVIKMFMNSKNPGSMYEGEIR